jgi:hypothetical protein
MPRRYARFLDSVGGDVPKLGDTLFLHMKGMAIDVASVVVLITAWKEAVK